MKFCVDKKKFTIENVLFMLCVIVSFAMLCYSLWGCFFDSIISDEAFSLYIVEGSYLDIVINTVQDVHPPFFYFILKFFLDIITFVIPSVNVVVLSKLISFASIASIFYFMVFKMSKKMPKSVVGISLIVLFCFGSFTEYGITIRMYGYSMLFVLLSFYYALQIVRYKQERDFRRFVLWFELAALSHYFSLMAVAGLLLFMIAYSLIFERKYFWTFYKYALYAVLFYVPWLVILCCQFAYLSGFGYWIPTLTTNSVSSIFSYVFSIKLVESLNKTWVTAFLTMLFLVVMAVNLFNKKLDKVQKWIASSGLFMMFFVVGVGLAVSVLLTPIFIERYTLPTLFVMYMCVIYNFYLFVKYTLHDLCLAILKKLSFNKEKCLKYAGITLQALCLVVVSIYGFINISKVIKHEKYVDEKYDYMVSYLNDKADDVIVSTYGSVQHPVEYMSGHFIYGLYDTSTCWWENITGVHHPKLSADEIKQMILNGENVYLIECGFDMNKLNGTGLKWTYETAFDIEHQWYTIYHVGVYKLELA